MKLSVVLAVLAAVLHAAGYFLYWRRNIRGSNDPNLASWATWTVLAALNAFSYAGMAGDWLAGLQFFTGSVACALVFVALWARGSFSRIDGLDLGAAVIGIIAAVAWYVFRSATVGNYIVLAALIASFEPTIRRVLREPTKESPLPWWLWVVALAITITNLFVLGKASVLTLILPGSLIVLHGVVGWLCRPARQAPLSKGVSR